MSSFIKSDRKRIIRKGSIDYGPVVYWMSRDQRVNDNWALLYAQEKALEFKRPLVVLFYLTDNFLYAPYRHYVFMLEGLQDVSIKLRKLNIAFKILSGDSCEIVSTYLENISTALLVMDFSPLKIQNRWIKSIRGLYPVFQVDSRNVVPVWIASDKREYAARTIRPKLMKKMKDYLDTFPQPLIHPYGEAFSSSLSDFKKLDVDRSVDSVDGEYGGSEIATMKLKKFLKEFLAFYDKKRNDPNENVTSRLSPYIHFGHISPQRIIIEVSKQKGPSVDAFIEEVFVRRELAENYCYYEANYDSYGALPEWGRKTLDQHTEDERPWLYDRDHLEFAKTHDDLWNCAQKCLVEEGYIHGYLRMYWAKMILLWSPSPEDAFDRALYLNDKYALDGRDPNGYVGVGWSIGGLHDRPWPRRPVFGTVRSMALSGCKRKFNVNQYIEKRKKK